MNIKIFYVIKIICRYTFKLPHNKLEENFFLGKLCPKTEFQLKCVHVSNMVCIRSGCGDLRSRIGLVYIGNNCENNLV